MLLSIVFLGIIYYDESVYYDYLFVTIDFTIGMDKWAKVYSLQYRIQPNRSTMSVTLF